MKAMHLLLLGLLLAACAPISATEPPQMPAVDAFAVALEEFTRRLPEEVATMGHEGVKTFLSDPNNYVVLIEPTDVAFEIRFRPKPYNGVALNVNGPTYFVSLDGKTLVRID